MDLNGRCLIHAQHLIGTALSKTTTFTSSSGRERLPVDVFRQDRLENGLAWLMSADHLRCSMGRGWCREATCHSRRGESRQQRSPVAVVVISSNGEGNRSVGSLEVKALEGRGCLTYPYRRA